MRVHELVEPRQRPNDSLRERSPPGVRVQESAESPSLMDELRQMAAELNRRLERTIAGLRARRSGPSDGRYPVQPLEQGMPSVARPYAAAQRCGPMDERFFSDLSMKGRHQSFDQLFITPPDLTESSTFFCQGLEPRQTVFRNTLDRR